MLSDLHHRFLMWLKLHRASTRKNEIDCFIAGTSNELPRCWQDDFASFQECEEQKDAEFELYKRLRDKYGP